MGQTYKEGDRIKEKGPIIHQYRGLYLKSMKAGWAGMKKLKASGIPWTMELSKRMMQYANEVFRLDPVERSKQRKQRRLDQTNKKG